MKVHELKTLPVYFEAIKNGTKTFEVRKNDRNFQSGDMLLLREYDPAIGYIGSNDISVLVAFILSDTDYVKSGYVCMSIKTSIGTIKAEKCRHRLSTIQQSYPGHMDEMLKELDEIEDKAKQWDDAQEDIELVKAFELAIEHGYWTRENRQEWIEWYRTQRESSENDGTEES